MWDSRVDDELGAAIQLKSLFVDALQFVMLHKENLTLRRSKDLIAKQSGFL
jgi:hypothetical protein